VAFLFCPTKTASGVLSGVSEDAPRK